jgi:hypothetical protein
MAQNDKIMRILFRRSGQNGIEYSESQNEAAENCQTHKKYGDFRKFLKSLLVFHNIYL